MVFKADGSDEIRGQIMFDNKKFLYREPFSKVLLVMIAVLVLLFAARSLNLMMWYNVSKAEVKKAPSFKMCNYQFRGFSNYEDSLKQLQRTALVRSQKDVHVVSFFNFIYPAVYLVQNNSSGKSFVNVGRVTVYPEIGTTSYFLHSAEILETRIANGKRAVIFGDSLFPILFNYVAAYISFDSENKGNGGRGISFIVNNIDDSKYLKIPYYIYFYLPILLILVIASNTSRTFYLAFLYYPVLFLLFDFKKALFTVPFSWVFHLTSLKMTDTIAIIGALAVVVAAIIFTFAGLSGRKQRSESGNYLTAWTKGLIAFFILLPVALRF